MDRALTWFANIWLGLVVVLNLISIAGFHLSSESFWDRPLKSWCALKEWMQDVECYGVRGAVLVWHACFSSLDNDLW